MDKLSLTRHHMYRFSSYGFITVHFKDMQYTDN